MTLAERLTSPPVTRRGGRTCRVGKLLAELPPDDYLALAQALCNRDWTASNITEALRDEGHDIAVHQVRQHRRGHCTELSCEAHETGVLQ